MPTITAYEHGQFSWIDLMSPDPDSSKAFYAGLFGWSAEDRPTDAGVPYTIFKLGDDELCGMGPLPPDLQQQGVPPAWNSYINVDDLKGTLTRVETLGGKVYMPTMKVMEAGWMTGIMDPTGGRVFLWQKNEHIGATRVNEPGCFCWNELATRDIERAREFYGKLLGWDFDVNPHAPTQYYIIQNRGRMNGGLMQMNEQWPASIPPHWGVYFTVENAETACVKLKELGGEVCAAPFEIPTGRIAVVADPHQAVFQLLEFAEKQG